jgi:F-type H+-transporting ATPase subunit a
MNRIKVIFWVLLSVSHLSLAANIAGPTEKNNNLEDKKFQPGEMIMHHITDSHEWHILDWKGKHVSIPLPIIVFHKDKGLEFFMSSKFNHGKNVYRGYKMDHGHIIAVNEAGEKDYIESQKIWDFSITKNVFSLFFSIVIILLVFIKAGNLYKQKPHNTPKGFWNFLELMILFVRDDIAKPAIGEKNYHRFLPFLLTVFFFIWLNNLLGLVPLFPGGANLTGNIAVPMILAGMVFIITTISGKKTYWKHIFAMPGVPKPVLLILTPVEIIGMLLKPFVLMIRLFANITAGHIIILSFFSLIFIFGEINPVAGYGASIMSVSFVIFMSFLELLVVFLQAYVFTLLAAIYFGSAVEEEH